CPSTTNRLSRGAVACTPSWLIRWPVPTADVVAVAATNVRVTVEIVVSVDCDIVVSAPAAAPAPTTAPKRAHHYADAERDCHTCCVVSRWRIVNRRVGVVGGTVHHDGIIRRHINNLGIRLL